jgi:hypothetical protein
MFPDSVIAKTFKCGVQKTRYVLMFGISDFVEESLIEEIGDNAFTVQFDESYNKKLGLKQMDIHLRHWSSKTKNVVTRYFSSVFMRHSTAADLKNHFTQGVTKLQMKNCQQIGMDSPNVNWSFYNSISLDYHNDFGKHMIEIGACGLHGANCAFKNGMKSTGHNVKQILCCAFYLFYNTPARQEDFENATGCKLLPEHFANCRFDSKSSV